MTDPEDRLLAGRVLDLAAKAYSEDKPQATGFLDPRERDVAEAVLRAVEGVRVLAVGGYPGAERRRLVIYPDYFPPEAVEAPLAAVELTGAGVAQLRHGDVLGALLGAGVERDQVGDLLLAGDRWQVVVTPPVAGFLCTHLRRVGRVAVAVQPIDPEQVEAPAARVKEVRATVASPRLDAVASIGFGTSRTRMARDIRAERVKLNWKVVTDPAAAVKEGDVISVRGRGRAVVERLSGVTRKGRIGVTVKRYL
ncbi:MAG TPA: YlmH/Sll1252 family protein [Limnochordales bacterium]|nr:YlmH/Sll1252 family protein [Limnochordales bacterium]